ncbi:DUF1501 domain-containing protein [Humisphaera borealis]|uniref:DUF1501 domain-containing protein n=1 Tax=Humisphaera borealis TaxID=2807512 RepID=A0A7M2WVP0_9BACT|nr:DUF1501 domain-containing protein [Humisphaera borealis]QOV89617.1 DUF1501 domain-containing protein [Humisphaera borealis]
MSSCQHYEPVSSRRDLLLRSGLGVGAAALASVLGRDAIAAPSVAAAGASLFPNFAPKAKRVICLFQSGGPSHLDLYDDKPVLRQRFNEDLPDSVRQGQRITGMVASQARLALQPSKFTFAPGGKCGTPFSDLIPNIRSIADDVCLIRSVNTEAINHDPAITFFQTGSQQPGRPSMGSWIDYGLGTVNSDLPAFVVLISVNKDKAGQGLLARLWGSGFLPSRHQGVQFRGSGQPVLHLADPPGVSRERRRMMLDGVAELNRLHFQTAGDPEIETRISQYELAFRMQASVPDLMDLSKEPKHFTDAYGADVATPGSFARNCLIARRLAERGVRFIQLYHRDWDHHGDLHGRLPKLAADVDQPSAALVKDLKDRGMLEDTLVIWGGEFGRTPYAQGNANRDAYGRDHHGKTFSIWMAGGGIKGGMTYGSSDDFGFNAVENPVHIHDLQATILHCLGVDHTKLTYRFQGRQFRLTDVHGHVVKGVLA